MSSTSSDDLGSKEDIENMILEEPIFYVLGQFLQTEDDKNIATVVQDLAKEVKGLKELLACFLQKQVAVTSSQTAAS